MTVIKFPGTEKEALTKMSPINCQNCDSKGYLSLLIGLEEGYQGELYAYCMDCQAAYEIGAIEQAIIDRGMKD